MVCVLPRLIIVRSLFMAFRTLVLTVCAAQGPFPIACPFVCICPSCPVLCFAHLWHAVFFPFERVCSSSYSSFFPSVGSSVLYSLFCLLNWATRFRTGEISAAILV